VRRLSIIFNKGRLMQKNNIGVVFQRELLLAFSIWQNITMPFEVPGVKCNGKFLGLIEIISKYDTLMAEHLRRISGKEISDHYLGWKIQNELIGLRSKKKLKRK
jgi:ABC-type lipoprotein export system ATPase subunit